MTRIEATTRVLITGGAGFIGSHLAEACLARGARVTILDNLSTGRPENVPAGALDKFQIIDVADKRDMDIAYAWKDAEVVFHLAGLASPKAYRSNPLGALEASSVGLKNVLDGLALERARVVFASTSEVYGDPEVHPQPEEYRGNVACYGPRSQYDEGKRYGEALCGVYQGFGANIGIARIFNTFGQKMQRDDGRLVPTQIDRVLRGLPLRIEGDGMQTRSLCYIDDLVRGLMLLAESDVQEPVNLGNPTELTVEKICGMIAAMGDIPADVEYVDAAPHDPRRRCPDITRARTMLGWEPQVSVAEGLARTFDWFRAQEVRS